MLDFVPKKQYLFFAPVSSSWKAAWGRRLSLTQVVTPDSTVSQLRYSFECGLPRSHVAICETLARFGKLNCLQFARDRDCPWNEETCNAAARGGGQGRRTVRGAS